MKDRVSLRSTHPAPCSRLRQLLVSLRWYPLQSRFARQLPQRGSLYHDLNCVLLFHTGTAQNRSVGAGTPRPPASPKICCMISHGVLFTGFFTAVAVQNDRCTGKGRRGRRPLQSGRKPGGGHEGAGVLNSPCAAAGNLTVILRRIASENDRLSQ